MVTRPADIDAALIKALVDAGLKSLLLGLESGSRNILDCIEKNSTPVRNLVAIDAVRQAGLTENTRRPCHQWGIRIRTSTGPMKPSTANHTSNKIWPW